jgi:hypothetical protein
MEILNATDATVEIFMDDGTGVAEGDAIMTLSFKRLVSASSAVAVAAVLHAGSPETETALGTSRNRMTMNRLVSAAGSNLDLSDALYLIRVTPRTDTFATRTRYEFKKCRRLSWNVRYPDVGGVASQAEFSFESYSITDL